MFITNNKNIMTRKGAQVDTQLIYNTIINNHRYIIFYGQVLVQTGQV